MYGWRTPKLFDRLNYKSKGENNEKLGVRVHSLVHNTSRVEGGVGALGCGLGWVTSKSIIHMDLHKPNNKLMHSLSTFGAHTSHGQTQTHDIHHNLDLDKATTFPLIVFFVLGHMAYTQMSFCPGTSKLWILKLRLLRLWRPITCVNLWLRWGLKQSCIHGQDLFNGM